MAEVVDKWQVLKDWVAERHDYFETQYKKSNFSADAAELGAFRSVYQTMCDLDRRSDRQVTLPGSTVEQSRRRR